jgi:hypothetical protein
MPEPRTRTDYVLVRTDDLGTPTYLTESPDPITREEFTEAARSLTPGYRLDAVKRSTEILFSAVGVVPDA